MISPTCGVYPLFTSEQQPAASIAYVLFLLHFSCMRLLILYEAVRNRMEIEMWCDAFDVRCLASSASDATDHSDMNMP